MPRQSFGNKAAVRMSSVSASAQQPLPGHDGLQAEKHPAGACRRPCGTAALKTLLWS